MKFFLNFDKLRMIKFLGFALKKEKVDGNYISNEYMNLRIGDSLRTEGQLIFEVISLRVFGGYVAFRDDTTFSRTCKDTGVATATCKLELMYTEKTVCLKCDLETPSKAKVVIDQNGERCSTNPTQNALRKDGFYDNKIYDRCKLEEFSSAGICLPCANTCMHCSGTAMVDCVACNPFNNKYLESGDCKTCIPGMHILNGECRPCSVNFCTDCPLDRCQDGKCAPTETYYEGKCCNIN